MFGLKQLWHSIQRLKAGIGERVLIAARSQPIGTSQPRSTLAAFEGLFVASMISTLFWSVLTVSLLRRH